jgi:hypothetical protein
MPEGLVINIEVARLGRELHAACERGRLEIVTSVLNEAQVWFSLHSATREEAAFWAGALATCLLRCANESIYELVDTALDAWKMRNRIAGGV